MRTRIFIISMFFMTFLISGSGCTKEDNINKLPPATQTGENTFGCKINGVVYKCSGYFNPARDILGWSGASGNYGDGRVAINALIAENEIHASRLIHFTFECVENQPGIYRKGVKILKQSPVEGYDTKVVITRFDKDVISGTFQMKFQYDDPDGTYEYTEGRFDIKRNN